MPALRALSALPVAFGLAAVLTVTGCQPNSTPHAATASQPASSAAAAPSGTGPSGSAPAGSAAASPSASPSASGFQNLTVTTAVRSELETAFAAAKGIPVSDIAGSTPGSVYYGYDAAGQTYWAQGDYRVAGRVPLSVQVGFQDGASTGFFKKDGTGAWQVTVAHEPVSCDELQFFPKAVLAAWSLPASPASSC
jgi:hypothetical protein